MAQTHYCCHCQHYLPGRASVTSEDFGTEDLCGASEFIEDDLVRGPSRMYKTCGSMRYHIFQKELRRCKWYEPKEHIDD